MIIWKFVNIIYFLLVRCQSVWGILLRGQKCECKPWFRLQLTVAVSRLYLDTQPLDCQDRDEGLPTQLRPHMSLTDQPHAEKSLNLVYMLVLCCRVSLVTWWTVLVSQQGFLHIIAVYLHGEIWEPWFYDNQRWSWPLMIFSLFVCVCEYLCLVCVSTFRLYLCGHSAFPLLHRGPCLH